MMKVPFKLTNHSYYCSDTNYYANAMERDGFGAHHYDTWKDFQNHWLEGEFDIDHDYNHVFRFDITPQYDPVEDIEYEDRFSLKLYFMLQRKGNFVPVLIRNLKEEDMEDVNKYLQMCWDYMKGQWEEFIV